MMTDYYSILGVNKSATAADIKTAFRRLAKKYHPDKNPHNPQSSILFKTILEAYTVLSNPNSKTRYDNLNSPNSYQSEQTKRRQNKHTVSPEDLKQRQYYQNYYKTKLKKQVVKPKQKVYSDYKYVLFATPIAVGLLLLVLSVFSPKPSQLINSNLKKIRQKEEGCLKPKNGDKLYSGYFGASKIFETGNKLKINNSTRFDAVVAIFSVNSNQCIQHAYLQHGYSIELNYLPIEGVYWKCAIGKGWSQTKKLYNDKIIGGFDSVIQYQNFIKKPVLFNQDHSIKMDSIRIMKQVYKNKNYISAEFDFFEIQ
jgi:curved DNA-binding protein CbpA